MCTSPITLSNPSLEKDTKGILSKIHGKNSFVVPCGKCAECLRLRQNDWMQRLVEEFRDKKKCCYVTLTYRDDNVPFYLDNDTGEIHLTVRKKHFQDCLKRFRIREQRKGKVYDFTYFVCSEYGPKHLRPHYHALFFGLNRRELNSFLGDWFSHFGFVKAVDIPYSEKDWFNVSRYVAKYCCKGMFENPKVKECLVDKCYHNCSKGLGRSYVDRMARFHLGKDIFKGRIFSGASYSPEYLEFVSSNLKVSIGDCRFHMCRFYRDKILNEKPFLQTQVSDYVFKKSCDLRDQRARKIQSLFDWSFDEAFCFTYLQDDFLLGQRDKDALVSFSEWYHNNSNPNF